MDIEAGHKSQNWLKHLFRRCLIKCKHQLIFFDIYKHDTALSQAAKQNSVGKQFLIALDQPRQRPRTVFGVVAFLRQPGARLRRKIKETLLRTADR